MQRQPLNHPISLHPANDANPFAGPTTRKKNQISNPFTAIEHVTACNTAFAVTAVVANDNASLADAKRRYVHERPRAERIKHMLSYRHQRSHLPSQPTVALNNQSELETQLKILKCDDQTKSAYGNGWVPECSLRWARSQTSPTWRRADGRTPCLSPEDALLVLPVLGSIMLVQV